MDAINEAIKIKPLKGNYLALEGKEVIVGQQFKNFSVISQDLRELKLSDIKEIRIFCMCYGNKKI